MLVEKNDVLKYILLKSGEEKSDAP